MRLALGCAALEQQNTGKLNSIDILDQLVVTAADDDQVNLYQLNNWKKTILFRAAGVQRVRFAHHQSTILAASKLGDGSVYYHSLHDNRMLALFRGHSDRISSLEVSPTDDTFITGAQDKTIRVWDLRCEPQTAVAIVQNLPSQPKLAYDPSGLIFACATSNNLVKLFDARQLDQPFAAFRVVGPEGNVDRLQWSNVQFSFDGNRLLLCSRQSYSVLLDSFGGEKVCEFTGYENGMDSLLEGGLSGDGLWFATGSESGRVYVYSTSSASVEVLSGGHDHSVRVCVWSRTSSLLATGGEHLALWIDKDDDQLHKHG
jgi:COMPASS component SWD2